MPNTFETDFKIRFDECDPFGRLSNANTFRLAVQAAMTASEPAGHDLLNGDTRWQLSEVGIEYLEPAIYGDTVRASTWATDWRDAGFSLEQELRVGNTLIAKLHTDWEIISLDSLGVIQIPTPTLKALFPAGIPTQAPPRTPYPEPPQPNGLFTAHRDIRWGHLNLNGWLDYGHYITVMEEVSMGAAAYLRWPPERLDQDGLAITARSHHISFNTHVALWDDLSIATYIGTVEETSFVRHYVFTKGHELPVAQAQTMWQWTDAESGEPADIPDAWYMDFAEQIAE